MDVQGLKNYLNCDTAFLVSIMQKFIEEVAEITKVIEDASARKNWEVVKSNAHKMLSSVRIFEMEEIILLLETIEIDAEEKNNLDDMNNKIERLSYLVKATIQEMKVSLEQLD